MNDDQAHDADDAEYIKNYRLHKVDRLKLEEAAGRLFQAADAWGKRDDGTCDHGTLMNEMYDAALNYVSVRLYTSTRIVVDAPIPAADDRIDPTM